LEDRQRSAAIAIVVMIVVFISFLSVALQQ